MRRYLKYIFFIFVGCQEPIELDFQSTDEYLVIDGFITDDNGPHVVNISKSQPFTNDEIVIFEKVQNAVVTITDDLGNVTNLNRSEPGRYETPFFFSGQVGRSYTLTVDIEENTFQSTPQLIPTKSSFSSVYFQQSVRETITDDGVVLRNPTVEFLCDVDYATQNSYAAISWESTYEYKTVLTQTPYDCYIDGQNNGFSSVLTNESVNVVSTSEVTVGELLFDVRFKSAFSLNAILYSMSEEAHDFHFKINQQRSSTGSVFDPQPFQIFGNIRNVANSNQTVLGYFGAYGKEESRIFVYPSNVDAPEPFDICSRVGGPGFPPNYCFDCASFPGAYTQRPLYWEDQ
ncbi:DUF4249 domain-containing protein [Ekhidna sp. To15]|uniref:DUF4249 domain-containing protein n=1 Tax=Ekhidna sp. To15 TaxID=3395267 RepID=UPI003F51E8D2